MNDHLIALFASEESIKESQTRLLLTDLLAVNKETAFGKKYDFEKIRTPEEYRCLVPLSTYEDIRPWVDQISQGNSAVLTQSRTLAFFKTSGSLAKPKLIPVTTDLMRQKVRTFGAYWEQIYDDYPNIRHGKLVSNFSDASEPETLPCGLQVFSESAFWAKRGRSLQSLDRWPLPSEVRQIKSPGARAYASARLLLQSDLDCIMCLNPSTLLFFCRTIQAHMKSLIEGLRLGQWGGEHSPQFSDLHTGEHTILSSHLRAEPAIADRLSKINTTDSPPELLNLWPSLSLIICWQSQVVQPYFKQLKPYTRGVAMRDYITQSSECMMAVPIKDSTSGGLLAHSAHYFEFIPEAEVHNEAPSTKGAWDVQIGSRYEVVVTTGGGLYRYRMGDCVQVNEFHGSVPVIEFLYRIGRTSSMTGEKLTEFQVLCAAKAATAICKIGPDEFLFFPCSGHQPHYSIALETDDEELTDQCLVVWCRAFEQQLKVVNGEYSDKCVSGRLGPIVPLKSFAGQLRNHRLDSRSEGVSEEQVKSEVLSAQLDLHKRVLKLHVIK